MTRLLDPLLLPQRLTARVLDDLHRLADAGGSVAELAGELAARVPQAVRWVQEITSILITARDHLAGLQGALEPISDDMDALRAAFAATNDQLELLRHDVTPQLAGVRTAAEGLHEEVRLEREAIDELKAQVEQMGALLAGQLASLRETLNPLVRGAEELREVIEPLETATERLGRFAERLPGPGRKRAGLLTKPQP